METPPNQPYFIVFPLNGRIMKTLPMSVTLIHKIGLKVNAGIFLPVTPPAGRPDTFPLSHENPASGKEPAIQHYRFGYSP